MEDVVIFCCLKMNARSPRQTLAGLLFLCLSGLAHAGTVTITVNLGDVLDAYGTKAATTCLFQLVCLGPNGVFDPIPAGAWVGGDDTVLAEAFPNADGWTSAAAFDLADGAGTPGTFTRQFTFEVGSGLQPGDKLGIRWFPTVSAGSYATTTPAAGMAYGEFTRQSAPLHGGANWVVPLAGAFVSFDPMVSVSFDSVHGKDPITAGAASLLVGLSPLELWRQTYFGTALNAGDAADAVDFAHDGVPNLVKFAFGLDPTKPRANSVPRPMSTGGNYVLSFTQPDGVSGITYGAEWSVTLQPSDWHAIPDSGSGAQHVFSVPIGNNTQLFIRQTVTEP